MLLHTGQVSKTNADPDPKLWLTVLYLCLIAYIPVYIHILV